MLCLGQGGDDATVGIDDRDGVEIPAQRIQTLHCVPAGSRVVEVIGKPFAGVLEPKLCLAQEPVNRGRNACPIGPLASSDRSTSVYRSIWYAAYRQLASVTTLAVSVRPRTSVRRSIFGVP